MRCFEGDDWHPLPSVPTPNSEAYPWTNHRNIKIPFNIFLNQMYIYARGGATVGTIRVVEADDIQQTNIQIEVEQQYSDTGLRKDCRVCLFGNNDGSSSGIGIFVRRPLIALQLLTN